MTLRFPAKVLIHVWSYDFFDMTLSTGKQRRHMINIFLLDHIFGTHVGVFIAVITSLMALDFSLKNYSIVDDQDLMDLSATINMIKESKMI